MSDPGCDTEIAFSFMTKNEFKATHTGLHFYYYLQENSLGGKGVYLWVDICICMSVTEAGQQISLSPPKASRRTVVLRHRACLRVRILFKPTVLGSSRKQGQRHRLEMRFFFHL